MKKILDYLKEWEYTNFYDIKNNHIYLDCKEYRMSDLDDPNYEFFFDGLKKICEKNDDIVSYDITNIVNCEDYNIDATLKCYCLSIVDKNGKLSIFPLKVMS